MASGAARTIRPIPYIPIPDFRSPIPDSETRSRSPTHPCSVSPIGSYHPTLKQPLKPSLGSWPNLPFQPSESSILILMRPAHSHSIPSSPLWSPQAEYRRGAGAAALYRSAAFDASPIGTAPLPPGDLPR